MALIPWRKTPPEAPPKAVIAAAMPLVGPDVERIGKLRRQQTTEGWQKDAWYFFDAVGELRSPVTFIANACSQATPFAAEVDPDTQLITGPTENDQAQRVAAMILGGAANRAQLLQTISVCWQVPGELFVVVRPQASRDGQPQPDQWLVLSGGKVSVKGGAWSYVDPMTLLPTSLGARDRLFRVWSPHPNDQAKADTAVRPALPILREVEKASMNIASKLDSRLAGNGILPFPQEADFPRGVNADGSEMSLATSVASFLMEAMSASMSNPGTAGAQAPIVLTMPSELIDTFSKGHMDLSTSLDGEVVELRNDALRRLAVTLDMPKDVAQGTQAESNHWSAWQVEESTYKIYIEPLLQRIADAITEHWFRPALQAMGMSWADTQRYVIDWDTAAIVKRPDATEDANWLWENLLISNEARRAVSGVPDDDIPDDEELELRRLESVVRGAPTMAADPEVSQRLFGFEIAPAAAGVSDADIEGAPELEPSGGTGSRALPAAPTGPEDVPAGLTAAAELISIDAFNRVGGRLLTAGNRGQFASVPRHSMHTVVRVPDGDHDRVTAGSFRMVPRVAEVLGVDAEALRVALSTYVSVQLWAQREHDPVIMNRYLRESAR